MKFHAFVAYLFTILYKIPVTQILERIYVDVYGRPHWQECVSSCVREQAAPPPPRLSQPEHCPAIFVLKLSLLNNSIPCIQLFHLEVFVISQLTLVTLD